MMTTRTVGIFLAGLTIGMLVLWGGITLQSVVNAQQGQWCIAPACQCGGSPVQAKIHSGPDAPLDLSGDLLLSVNSDGSFSGDLVRASDGARFKLAGQGVGRGSDLVIELGDGQRIFSHAVHDADIRECRGGMRGTLVGPTYGNFGDWGRRIISPTLSIER